MFLASSKLSRLAALKATLDRTDHLDEELIRTIVVHTSGRNPFPVMARLKPLIDAFAWTDAGLSLIAWQMPDWCVTRLCLDDRLWWCAMNPRQPVYWAPDEVDESHPILPIAILKAFLTALIRRDCAAPPLPAHPGTEANVIPAHCEWFLPAGQANDARLQGTNSPLREPL